VSQSERGRRSSGIHPEFDDIRGRTRRDKRANGRSSALAGPAKIPGGYMAHGRGRTGVLQYSIGYQLAPDLLGMGSTLMDADQYRGSDDIAPRLPPSTRAKIHVWGSTHTTYRQPFRSSRRGGVRSRAVRPGGVIDVGTGRCHRRPQKR
jgi:hypothetical protein